jgi:iron complex outermembrane receptor protein
LSYQYTHRNFFDDIESGRVINADTLLSQAIFTRYSSVTNYIGGGIDYAFNKRFNIAYDLRLTANDNTNNSSSANNFSIINTQNEFYKSLTPITNQGNGLFVNHTISSKYKIDSLGSEWTNEIAYTYSKNNNEQLYTNIYQLPVSPDLAGNGNSLGTANMADVRSDLLWKLKHEFSLETGFRISTAADKYNALYYTQTGNLQEQVDAFQTNKFSYRENINSAYLQLTKTYSGFILKAGLRFENTNIMGHQLIPLDTTFSIDRNDLFPYFYAKRYLFKIFGYPLTGNAVVRRSITRPGYDALNPAPKFIYPFRYSVGNPKLQPQFTSNYEINATYKDFPVFALGVNDTKDVFSQVTYQNDSSNIAYRTFDNLGRNKEIYG